MNGKPQIRRVETGLSDDVNVEIKSGLSEGDTIIASDHDDRIIQLFFLRQFQQLQEQWISGWR